MNIVVKTDGSVDLDDRPSATVGREALESKGWMVLALTVDRLRVGQAMFLPSTEGDRNLTAQAMVASLTGAHVWFNGPVVLADLEPETAHRLIDEL